MNQKLARGDDRTLSPQLNKLPNRERTIIKEETYQRDFIENGATSIEDHKNHFYSVLNSKNDWVINNDTNTEATTADGWENDQDATSSNDDYSPMIKSGGTVDPYNRTNVVTSIAEQNNWFSNTTKGNDITLISR